MIDRQREAFARLFVAAGERRRSGAREGLGRAGFEHAALAYVPADSPLPELPAVDTAGTLARSPLALPLDIELVESGVRPLALVHGPEASLRSFAGEASARGMATALSTTEMVPAGDSALGHYANLSTGRRAARAGSGACRALLVGRDPDIVALGWLAEHAGWDGALGLCLGYPPCCVSSFERSWAEAVRTHGGDLGLKRLDEAAQLERFSWRMNLFARYTGRVLVDHFPCSLRCVASEREAARLEQLVAELRPASLSDIVRRSRCRIVHARGVGVLMVRRESQRVIVDPPGAGGALGAELRAGAPLEVVDADVFRVAGQRFEGRVVDFASAEGARDDTEREAA